MSMQASTKLEEQIRSQPDELFRLLTSDRSRDQTHVAADRLQRSRRIWLVGTGTSHHAAILGAGMLQDAGRSAVAVSSMRFVVWAPIVGPDDAIIVITHTGETAYALAARALATSAGLDVITVTKRGTPFPHAIETCPAETAETYTVSYTTALLVLAMIAKEMGAESITEDSLALVPGAVRNAIDAPGIEAIRVPERTLVDRGSRTRRLHRSRGRLEAPGGRSRDVRGAGHRVPAPRLRGSSRSSRRPAQPDDPGCRRLRPSRHRRGGGGRDPDGVPGRTRAAADAARPDPAHGPAPTARPPVRPGARPGPRHGDHRQLGRRAALEFGRPDR